MKKLIVLILFALIGINSIYAGSPKDELQKIDNANVKVRKKCDLNDQAKIENQYLEFIAKNPSYQAQAYIHLGELFSVHVPAALQNPSKAMDYYIKAEQVATDSADIGMAKYNIALIYYRGFGVPQDFLKAAEKCGEGVIYSNKQCVMLGEIAELGLLGDRDLNKALEFYYRAAQDGNDNVWSKIYYVLYTIDQIEKGTLNESGYANYINYMKEVALNGNYDKGIQYLSLSAQEGFVPSQCEYGICYIFGQGVKADYNNAMEWSLKAANQGFAPSQNNVGYLYDIRGKRDDAYVWYEKAALQGLPLSQMAVGFFYQYGLAKKPVDYYYAQEWYQLACDQGLGMAKTRMKELYSYVAKQEEEDKRAERVARWEAIGNMVAGVANIFANISNNKTAQTNANYASSSPSSFKKINTGSGIYWKNEYYRLEKMVERNFRSALNKGLDLKYGDETSIYVSSTYSTTKNGIIPNLQKQMTFARQSAAENGVNIPISEWESVDIKGALNKIR